MPRYFFEVTEDEMHTFADLEGRLCSGAQEAEAVAATLADELGQDQQYRGFLVRVTDHDGREVTRVRVSGRGPGRR